jgi:hypothetical protein
MVKLVIRRDKYREIAYSKVKKVLNTSLYPKMIIHHLDGDFTNNENSNLVVCEDRSYHMLLHQKKDAKYGRKVERKRFSIQQCYLCNKFDKKKDMMNYKDTSFYFHLKCLVDKFTLTKEGGNGVGE